MARTVANKEVKNKEVLDLIDKINKTSKKEIPLGEKQANDIMEMYNNTFNDIQREAFLLGRISALLQFGNAISEGANESIKLHEETLKELKTRMNKEAKKTTKKRTTKKEVKDE